MPRRLCRRYRFGIGLFGILDKHIITNAIVMGYRAEQSVLK
ncbi:hypothetical protein [Mahella australiensis]|nr:hypothetical protein [Mahella australiensis]